MTGVITEDTIRRAGELLAEAAPPRAKIIVFGSHARGDAGASSDLDLLVIEPAVENGVEESVRLRRVLRGLGVPVDIVVISEDLARRRAKVPGTMVDRALREGRVVAES